MTTLKERILESATGIFGREAVVQRVDQLSPKVKRLTLQGPQLIGLSWSPGDKIKLHAGGHLRSYTPSSVDKVAGVMEVIFYLHGEGRSANWADSAKGGEVTQVMGPASSVPMSVDTPDWALFLGDETTLGLAQALIATLANSTRVLGAIELSKADEPAISALGLRLEPAIRNDEHGAPLKQWLQEFQVPSGKGIVWISGEAITAAELKQTILAKGVENASIHVKPYWSLKGHAHRKKVSKQISQ